MKSLTVLFIIPLMILAILSSWVSVHIVAVFGPFLAVSYLLWRVLMPAKIPCLMCKAVSDGGWCTFCQRTTAPNQTKSPKNFKSVLLNVLFIFAVSLVSLGLVYTEGTLLKKLALDRPAPTASFVIPPKGQYRVGEIFPLKVELRGLEQPVNAVQADIGFDPAYLEVVEISTKDSFATIFVQKEINNSQGYARINGGLPNPGYSGARGLFATVYLRAKSAGAADVSYLPTSMILANDGRGSNILKDLARIPYFIVPNEVAGQGPNTQTATFDPNVLGTSTDESQLVFFDRPDSSVPEQSVGTVQEPPAEPQSNFLETAVSLIERADTFILSLWPLGTRR